MSKLLANEIANYGDNAPIDIKEGLNIPTGKPLQAAGVSGTSGQVLSSTGTTIEWVTPFDGDYNSLSNLPSIPAAQVPADWNATSGAARILNKPVVPPQPSVTTASAGTAALAYNSLNGEFTFTPPDLSGYATEAWVGSQGYLTSYTETDTLDSVVARGNNTGGDIVVSDNLYLGGSGTTSSYRLYNTGSDIWIQNSQTGGKIKASAPSGFEVTGGLYSNTLINVQGGVTLYEDSGLSGSEIRLTTTGTGMTFYGDIELGSGDLTTTGKLYYSNNFATTGDLPNATTYHGMFAHVHAEGHGYFAHGGLWTQLLDTGSALGDLADVSATAPNTNDVLTWNGSGWAPAAAQGGGGGSYADSDVDTHLNVSAASTNEVLSWDGSDYAWVSNSGLADVVSDTSPQLGGNLDLNSRTINGTGSINFTGTLTATSIVKSGGTSSQFLKADGSVDSNSYLTSYTETDPVFSASEAAGITSTDTTNWDTAYGWGNHAGQGYLTSVGSINTLTDVNLTTPLTNQTLVYNGSQWVNSYGASGLQSRATAQASTGTLANGAATNVTLGASKSYLLMKVQTSAAAWVTLYTDTGSRSSDSSRLETTDPAPGSGVIAEVITSAASTQIITPGVMGWNDDGTPSTNVYAKVVNKSGASANITVTITYVALEI